MWQIRQDQTEAFRRHHLRKFEDEMVAHLQKFAAQHWNAIGEQAGREAIRWGIEQAKKYGFTNRGPLRFYIELMFMLGGFFDSDPQCAWAIRILRDPANMDQMTRAERLHQALLTYWDAVAGPKNKFLFAALHRLVKAKAEDYLIPGAPLVDCLLLGLKDLYPQKCEYVGDPSLRVLLSRTLELANRHGFSSDQDLAMMTALTFFLGHGCTNDPLYGWIGRRLADPKLDTAQKRSAELKAKAMLYLKHSLEGNEAA